MLAFRRVAPSSVGRFSLFPKSFSSIVPQAVVTTSEIVSIPDIIKPSYSLVRHPFSINGKPLPDTPAKPEDLFAVVELSGTQYKVTLDDVLIASKMEGIDIGQILDLNKVMLVGSRKATVVGRPYVEGAQVIVAVEEMSKDKKVIIFKTRRRKHSRSLRGFRRDVTVLRVVDIIFGEKLEEDGVPEIF